MIMKDVKKPQNEVDNPVNITVRRTSLSLNNFDNRTKNHITLKHS
jgi:hypothetical protein